MKGQTRNIETFKVGSNKVNEFEFHKHQGEMSEHHSGKAAGTGVPQTRAERVQELTKAAHEKVVRRKKRVKAK